MLQKIGTGLPLRDPEAHPELVEVLERKSHEYRQHPHAYPGRTQGAEGLGTPKVRLKE